MSETVDNQKQSLSVIRDASVETILAEQILAKFLRTAGDICPYEALQEALGKNPQVAPAYGYIKSARQRFERKHGCVLAVVPKQGIKWRSHKEVATAQWEYDHGRVRRLGKRAERNQKTTLSAEADKELGKELVAKRNVNLAMASMVRFAASSKAEKRIETAVSQSTRVLAASEALKALSRS